MGSTRALIAALALAFGASSSAFAADLLPPPPPLVEPAPVQADFGGWYLRGDAGVGFNQLDNLRSSFDPTVVVPNPRFDSASFEEAVTIGAGVGYRFNGWLRADVTGEYRTPTNYWALQSYGCGGGRCSDHYNAQHSAAVFLANAYVDLGTWGGFTPYVGGGVGVAVNWLNNLRDWDPVNGGWGIAPNSSRTNFAWAAAAGVAYHVTPNLEIELGYRYLDMGRIHSNPIGCFSGCTNERQSFELASHDIRLGLRYTLAAAPSPVFLAPPGPLVRKY